MTHNVPAAMAGEEEDGMARTEAGRQIDETVAAFRKIAPIQAAYAQGWGEALEAVEEAVKWLRSTDSGLFSGDVITGWTSHHSAVLAAIATLRHSGDGE